MENKPIKTFFFLSEKDHSPLEAGMEYQVVLSCDNPDGDISLGYFTVDRISPQRVDVTISFDYLPEDMLCMRLRLSEIDDLYPNQSPRIWLDYPDGKLLPGEKPVIQAIVDYNLRSFIE